MFALSAKRFGYLSFDPLMRAAQKRKEPKFFLTQSLSQYRARCDEVLAEAVKLRDQALESALKLEGEAKALSKLSKVDPAKENPLAEKARAFLLQSEAKAKDVQAQKLRNQIDDSVNLLLNKLEEVAQDISQAERDNIAKEKIIFTSSTTELESTVGSSLEYNCLPRFIKVKARTICTMRLSILIERRIVQMEDGRGFLVVLQGDAASKEPLKVHSITDSLDQFSESELRAIAADR